MKCPFCGHLEDKVVDSRESKEGEVIRRRRECLSCGKRFTSYERIDQIPHLVVKKDGRREPFDRAKIVEGAVGMVEHALQMLSEKNILELDGERRAAMVSNLLVVLCGHSDPQPVLNTGTLYN